MATLLDFDVDIKRLMDSPDFEAALGQPSDAARAYFESGGLHLKTTEYQAALDQLERARQEWPQGEPYIQLIRANALIHLRQYDAAFSALESSHEGFKSLGVHLPGGGSQFYWAWALPGLLQGWQGMSNSDLEDLLGGGQKVVAVLRKAQAEGLKAEVWSIVDRATEELPSEMQEFREFIELMDIADPFERMDLLRKRITANWPEGLDCADAVREQRR